jgi:hypothetical protein
VNENIARSCAISDGAMPAVNASFAMTPPSA